MCSRMVNDMKIYFVQENKNSLTMHQTCVLEKEKERHKE